MGVIETGGRVASDVVEGLKHQPLALALVVVNLLFLSAGIYIVSKVADQAEATAIRIAASSEAAASRTDRMLNEVLRFCQDNRSNRDRMLREFTQSSTEILRSIGREVGMQCFKPVSFGLASEEELRPVTKDDLATDNR